MAGSGKYVITLDAMINDSKIRAQIAAIQKQVNAGAFNATGGKSGKSGTTMMAEAGKTAKQSTKEIGKMSKSLAGVQKTSKGAGLGLLDVTKKVVAFGAVTSAIQLAGQGIRSMVGNVVELDGALRELII